MGVVARSALEGWGLDCLLEKVMRKRKYATPKRRRQTWKIGLSCRDRALPLPVHNG